MDRLNCWADASAVFAHNGTIYCSAIITTCLGCVTRETYSTCARVSALCTRVRSCTIVVGENRSRLSD